MKKDPVKIRISETEEGVRVDIGGKQVRELFSGCCLQFANCDDNSQSKCCSSSETSSQTGRDKCCD